MLTEDLKTVIELMELSGGNFATVKLNGYKAYATNGTAMVVREVTPCEYSGYILKVSLPMLKAIYAVNKKNNSIEEDLDHLFNSECSFKFPSVEQMDSVFDSKFEYEINFDANDLIKVLKSLKSKENSIILKIKDNASPFMIVHENGKAIIATKKGE